jgi:hypothetical protein
LSPYRVRIIGVSSEGTQIIKEGCEKIKGKPVSAGTSGPWELSIKGFRHSFPMVCNLLSNKEFCRSKIGLAEPLDITGYWEHPNGGTELPENDAH